jgi:hypothetical protein
MPEIRLNVSEYPGRPVLKAPVWTWEVPVYFFTGGMAGASALLALVADLSSQRRLARNARLAAAAGAALSPPLLIADLGRPERFANMLRTFRPTSAMSMGSWLLGAFSAGAAIAGLAELTGRLRRPGRVGGLMAGLLGPALAIYTGVLLGQTSVPAWARARRVLPALFAASSAATAGGLACIVTPPRRARGARRLAIGGALAEVALARGTAGAAGDHERAYRTGPAGMWARGAEAFGVSGAVLLGLMGRRRWAAVAGGVALVSGSLCTRVAIWRAGPASAALTGSDREPV